MSGGIFDSFSGVLGLDTNPWSKGTKSAGKDLDGLKGKWEKFTTGLRGFRRTGFGEGLEIAVGGGALRVIGEVGAKIGEAATKLSEVNKLWKEGKADAGDMVNEIFKGIPVFDKFYEAGRQIREVLTGEKAELEAINEQIKIQDEGWQRSLAVIRDGKAAVREFGDELRKLKVKDALAAMPDGVGKGLSEAYIERSNSIEEIQKKAAEQSKKMNEDLASGNPAYEQLLKTKPDASIINAMKNDLYNLDRQQKEKMTDLEENKQKLDDFNKSMGGYGQTNTAIDNSKEIKQDLDKINASRRALTQNIQVAEQQQRALAAQLQSAENYFTSKSLSQAGDALAKPFKDAFDKASEYATKMRELMAKNAEENKTKLAELAKSLTESALTPIQKFSEEMTKAIQLYQLNRIDADTYQNFLKKSEKEYDDASDFKKAEYHPAPLVDRPADGRTAIRLPELANPIAKAHATLMDILKELIKNNTLTQKEIDAINDGSYALPLPGG
jgi:hypothetical protein